MKNKIIISGLLSIMILSNACDKKEFAASNWNLEPDMFIAGSAPVDATISGSDYKPTYWYSDQKLQLSDPGASSICRINKILFAGGKQYMAGSSLIDGKQKATVWVNDVISYMDVTGKASEVKDMAVVNGKIFCCGWDDNNSSAEQAAYWVDGDETFFQEGYKSIANAISVYDNEIILGGFRTFQGRRCATEWNVTKSDMMDLSDGINNSEVVDLHKVKGIVYAISNSESNYKSIFWTGDLPQEILGGDYGSRVAALSVTDNGTGDLNFDIAGIRIDKGLDYPNQWVSKAAYWKNGSLMQLQNNEVVDAVTDIVKHNNDIFILGSLNGPYNQIINTVYWKNGVPYSVAPTGAGSSSNICRSMAFRP
jgi:hypothetical protein